ncbi:MAG: hypothetical protein ACOCRX_12070 [Candidatus Woesearchaeota archaeon]
MMQDINIGKFTLESLTTGMYFNAMIIFREYIQNATDAIDEAVNCNLLNNKDEGKINIQLNSKKKSIIIKDNGIGVPTNKAWNILCDIGNSEKHHQNSRGFRGIGRLGGLSYCQKLYFITSTAGEKVKSIIVWDSRQLKNLLKPGRYNEYDLSRVVTEVAEINYEQEKKSSHYFKVVLENVNENNLDLLNEDKVRDYISQVAPIPFDAQKFYFYSDNQIGIKTKLKNLGKSLEEYMIYINDDPNPQYKTYKMRVELSKNKTDKITKIEYIKEKSKDGDILFWGWYSIRKSFKGVIHEENVSGLRIRNGNILIGDGYTLDEFFTEPRFNRYYIGEIYIYDTSLIPNARRDQFEKDEAYWKFKERLEKYTKNKLSKLPRYYSDYNSAQRKINKSEETMNEINEKIKNGLSSNKEKNQLKEKKEKVKKTLKKNKKKLKKSTKKIKDLGVKPSTNSDKTLKKAEKIEKVSDEVDDDIDNAEFIISKELSNLSKKERKILSEVFEVIDSEMSQNEAENLEKKIIQKLKPNSKKISYKKRT